ncbi:Very-long-chain 3-oxoacyl-CoA reductase [Lamellibrachia satsuma]|nr:Very-long-chain 3-oxoacyl-CoA reductase [Lamellibrachia satsuma]
MCVGRVCVNIVTVYVCWAVVTGSTDGIGKAYAFELARRGLNVVLVSRSAEKLADTAVEIEKKYQVKTKTVAVDFTGGPDIYEVVREELAGLEVGVLVNNVGITYNYPEFFNLLDDKRIRDIITCNIDSVTFMTRLVLTGMLERRKGAIINVASVAGVTPTPLLTIYSATKAYIDFFSRALQVEYKTKGIIVQSVRPFFVSTKLSKIRRANLFVPTPISYARAAIATVGIETNTFGCMSHALQKWLYDLVPEWLFERLTLSTMLAIRNRALKRAEKQE